ncbi:MAG: GntR family transcriptional regulator [Tissierellia bacterium]|nr:GntR family transcriptional regulator [Tissierellia bacterium]
MAERKFDADEIYEVLRDRIIHLDYEPGLVLNETDIAEEFNTSRTPVRSAFKRLQRDKLLNIVPRFGAQVTAIDFKQMKHVFEITRVLDSYAARLAAERISDEEIKKLEEIVSRMKTYDISKDYQKAIDDDEDFHQIIFSSCGNPWLEEILTSLHYHTERLWHYCEPYFDSIELFTNTLSKILEAIKNKDYDGVERYSREHIDDFVLKIKKEML